MHFVLFASVVLASIGSIFQTPVAPMPELSEFITQTTSVFNGLGVAVIVAAGAIIGLLGSLVGRLVRKTR